MGGSNTQYQRFPTQHPFVKNDDGTSSNVVLGTFGLDNKSYVIPTMVEGKQLTGMEAIDIAKKHGINNYPEFNTATQADDWARKYHGNVQPDGTLKY